MNFFLFKIKDWVSIKIGKIYIEFRKYFYILIKKSIKQIEKLNSKCQIFL